MYVQLLNLIIPSLLNLTLSETYYLDEFKLRHYQSFRHFDLSPVLLYTINHNPKCLVAYDSILSSSCPSLPSCGISKSYIHTNSILDKITFCYYIKPVASSVNVVHNATVLSPKHITLSSSSYTLSSVPDLEPNNQYIVLTTGNLYAITTYACYSQFLSPKSFLPSSGSFVYDGTNFVFNTYNYHQVCSIKYVPLNLLYQYIPAIVLLTRNSTVPIINAIQPTFNRVDTYSARINDYFVLNRPIHDCPFYQDCVISRNEIQPSSLLIHPTEITVVDRITSAIIQSFSYILSLLFDTIISIVSPIFESEILQFMLKSLYLIIFFIFVFCFSGYAFTSSIFLSIIICIISNLLKSFIVDLGN